MKKIKKFLLVSVVVLLIAPFANSSEFRAFEPPVPAEVISARAFVRAEGDIFIRADFRTPWLELDTNELESLYSMRFEYFFEHR